MRDDFTNYMLQSGYKELTPQGKPSTVYDYPKWIEAVCIREDVRWESLAENINAFIQKYDRGGTEADYGNKSHRSVINALKRFSEFLEAKKEL